jgi:hypothetical protein
MWSTKAFFCTFPLPQPERRGSPLIDDAHSLTLQVSQTSIKFRLSWTPKGQLPLMALTTSREF